MQAEYVMGAETFNSSVGGGEDRRGWVTSPTYFYGKWKSDKMLPQELSGERGFDFGDFFGRAVC